jgi:DNA-directed RNA polymerase subunit RPC12/RpoP
MSGQASEERVYEVTCPHCKKDFEAPLLAGAAERHRGFKCPHCRLFVPQQHADAPELLEPAD